MGCFIHSNRVIFFIIVCLFFWPYFLEQFRWNESWEFMAFFTSIICLKRELKAVWIVVLHESVFFLFFKNVAKHDFLWS